jgi:hypothetical protein
VFNRGGGSRQSSRRPPVRIAVLSVRVRVCKATLIIRVEAVVRLTLIATIFVIVIVIVQDIIVGQFIIV